MNITLSNTGKRYNREWIFRNMDQEFLQGNSYAITGINGSGKSTVLQVIAGAVLHTEGTITYSSQQSVIAGEYAYLHTAIAAPYLELIEEMTAVEFLQFHASFKRLKKTVPELLAAVGLDKAADKQIRYFSSGMKQRLKLGQAFFSDTSLLLLDEPLTNLDEDGIALYKNLWDEYTPGRLVIVSSNDRQEYEKCGSVIAIGNYKKQHV